MPPRPAIRRALLASAILPFTAPAMAQEHHDMSNHQGHDMSKHDMSKHDMTNHKGHAMTADVPDTIHCDRA